jgi:pimeloyl-ACP methyl ester carboxylesterase
MRLAFWRRESFRPLVLAVHGFEGYGAKDCAAEFSVLRARSSPRLRVQTVGYYAGDTGADMTLPGEPATTDTSLTVLGARLAELIRGLDEIPDLLGHSMGGLILAEALTSLPEAAVGRVVMLGVPFAGLPSAAGADVAQCREMTPGSEFLARVAVAGVRADLCVGSEADEDVPIESALALAEAPQVRLPASLRIHHGDLLTHPRSLAAVDAALAGVGPRA